MTWQNRQLKGKVIITDLSIIPCHEGAWSTQRQSKTVIRVQAAESAALQLNYCCTTNIFALHVDIIIDQQSVMISNWSVISTQYSNIRYQIYKYNINNTRYSNINCWCYCISSPISWSLLKDETLKVGDLPTDPPLTISQEQNSRLYNLSHLSDGTSQETLGKREWVKM